MTEATSVKNIAIIGAGLTGICALRRLSENNRFQLTCFERNYAHGGQWRYTDQTTEDDFGRPIHTAMYKYLKTNIPKPLMAIDGFPMDDYPSFPGQEDMLRYLTTIVNQCSLQKYIKFNTEIKQVVPVNPDVNGTKWMVKYGDSRKKNDDKSDVFDAVVVCTGTCWCPIKPEIVDECLFQGLIIHSIRYRRPEIFVGQTVAILGAKYSGIDIAFELSKHALKVYLCHIKNPLPTKLPENVVEVISGFKRYTPNSVILDNGEELFIDTAIYCTGFKYTYPILPEGIININLQNHVTSLYKNIISPKYSGILFIGIKKPVAFFPLSDHQALFVKAFLEGTVVLPTKEEMEHIIENENTRGDSVSQWEFDKELSNMAKNFKPLSLALQNIWDYHFEVWRTDFERCRKLSYEVKSSDSFVVS